VYPSGTQIDLIIPISSGTTLKNLQELAIERAARHLPISISTANDILLRHESKSGPFLHSDDKGEDVISAGETVFVILQDSSILTSPQNLEPERSMTNAGSAYDLQLCIITPHLAHCHEDVRTIPLVEDGKVFSASSTRRDLRAEIAASHDIYLGREEQQPQKCNCKLAEMSSSIPLLSAEGSLKVLVVSHFSKFT
jgi:hypothetical protein